MRPFFIERWIVRQKPGIPGVLAWVAALVALPVAARSALTPWLGATVWFPSYYPAVLAAGLLLETPVAIAVWLMSGLAGLFLIALPFFEYRINRELSIATGFYYFASGLVLFVAVMARAALLRLEAIHARDQRTTTELRHRLKNLIALVQSLSHQTARRCEGDPGRFQRELDGQLAALGSALDVMAEQKWEACRLPQLPRAVLWPFAASRQITLEGPRCNLTPEAAEPLALILHELATNAVKYGALSTPQGRVHIRWELGAPQKGASTCEMHWQESGGPLVHKPTRQGFGSRLLRKQRGIGGLHLVYDPSGVICSMSLQAVPDKRARRRRRFTQITKAGQRPSASAPGGSP